MLLWNMLKDAVAEVIGPARPPASPPTRRARPARAPISPPARHRPRAANERVATYDRMVRALLAEHKIRVRRWRTSMSGIAWYVTYRDGSVQRLIEAPRPKSPLSAAIFLHE